MVINAIMRRIENTETGEFHHEVIIDAPYHARIGLSLALIFAAVQLIICVFGKSVSLLPVRMFWRGNIKTIGREM